ncbi:creatininase family protein [Halalkalibacter akibai]|uniref:Creatinine amidohydrolase n=1 Tax=Halalkalibacter akibai (strain ATCC 43226 / DSM 21942 / CIP 109018 / JCM 9157 / 1139) TaxID=1236973 RepID=W4QN99_HALA3|nr:creatininase family protein [Halalkalibacter akibai]GAE33133.1 creatinine amidohydrolase [Halalkalibacter akibai JCM 9157]
MLYSRFESKAWQELFLPRLSTKQVTELPKDKGVVVLPIGAIEQHGPHLPVYTDTLIAEGLLTTAFEQLSQEDQVWMLPPLPYGKSTEHVNHPGTFTLSSQTLQQVILDIGSSVKASGFRRIVLFNTHGGNNDLLNMIARELRIETELMVFRMNGMDFKAEIASLFSPEELSYGIHGGDVETSLILAIEENWVEMALAPKEFYDYEHALDIKGGPYVAWVMDDLSNSGISGNATEATKEKGIEILLRLGSKIASTLQVISSFEMRDLKKMVTTTNRKE